MLLFQPTLPARGATNIPPYEKRETPFQPTLPARGATRFRLSRFSHFSCISTHAPRTGSDHDNFLKLAGDVISTHAPRTGSDPRWHTSSRPMSGFQPTLPARGATILTRQRVTPPNAFQPTLPARGATVHGCAYLYAFKFQPTLPARGATMPPIVSLLFCALFQPTLPARGATTQPSRNSQQHFYFNPRSPHGERPVHLYNNTECYYFNPRSPHGERRAYCLRYGR